MLRRKRFLIGSVIVFLAMGYLGYVGFKSSATYYYTVSELREQGSSVYGENLRVRGQVAAGSVEQEAGRLRFTIMEEGQGLSVAYRGTVPDTFKVGADVVVEGRINSEGILQAHTIMPKCPSRYEPQQ